MSFKPFQVKALPLVPKGAKVDELKVQELREGSRPTYSQIKSNFKANLGPGDRRFVLSELVSNQLSVEEEERRRFEKKVAEDVEQKIAELSENARQEGFTKGSEEGRTKAYEEEKSRVAKELEGLAAATKSLTDAKIALGEQYEKMMIEMVFQIAKIVVSKEITERPEIITNTISEILSRIGKEDEVMIRISPYEFEVIDEIHAEINQIARGGRISFDVDERLEAGSCVVESLSGEIGSDIKAKLEILRKEFDRNTQNQKQVKIRTGSDG